MKMLYSTFFLCATFLLHVPAHAEVFTCKQADGTTVFAYVPCKPEPTTAKLNSKSDSDETTTEPTDRVTTSAPIASRDLQTDIATIENELGELRADREKEIAAVPFSTEDPTVLSDLKSEIRATYQTKIEQKLNQLVALRARQRSSGR